MRAALVGIESRVGQFAAALLLHTLNFYHKYNLDIVVGPGGSASRTPAIIMVSPARAVGDGLEEITVQGQDILIVRFAYDMKQEEGSYYAVCREASIVGRGPTRPQAIKDLRAGLGIYLDDLRVRGEFYDALDEGKFPSFRLSLGGEEPQIKALSNKWHKEQDGATIDLLVDERAAMIV